MQYIKFIHEYFMGKVWKYKKMQLDVEVSPPANITSGSLTLTHVTFDLDRSDLWLWPISNPP